MRKPCNPRRKKPGESDAQYRKRCGPRPLGQIRRGKMGEKKNPRIPRKKGQPAGSKKHSDLYTDENPKGTIKGLKFATVKDAKASVSKINNSGKKHAHKIQAAVAMEQRAREMGKTSQAAVYRAYINKMKKITKKRNEEKKISKVFTKINEKLSKSKIKKMRDKFDKTGKLPPHLQKLAKLMDKHTELKNVVVPGLEWMADLKEGLDDLKNLPPDLKKNMKRARKKKSVKEKKWSDKYKKSIDCNNPKGFSQKAHCAGRKKRENVMKLSKQKLKEIIEEEYFNYLVEKNVPTQPAKWSYYKSQAKKKFDVYPSAYANAWAAKMYKKAGGGWKKGKKENIVLKKKDKNSSVPFGSGYDKVEEERGPCWVGYTQKGMKKKGDRMVPNCVKNEDYVVENYYDYKSFTSFMKETYIGKPLQEAEYQGKKVELGKVKRGGDKKFYVYVRDPQTKNVKKVSFGDTTGLSIKTKDPDRRRNFRSRHNCDNPGPKTKARYWSCRMWSGPNAVKNMLKK